MAARSPLEPAFLSRHAALGVLALMVAALALPLLVPRLPGYDRRAKYAAVPAVDGNYRFFERQIYDETRDIDLLVMGASVGWAGLDTNILQRRLSQQLGREAVVLNLGFNWRGDELVLLLLEELLAHRQVKLLVLDAPNAHNVQSEPHVHSDYWWVYGEHGEAMRGLPLRGHLGLYAESLLGSGRQLLGLVRRAPPEARSLTQEDSPTGSYPVQLGWDRGPFVDRRFPAPAIPAQDMIYGPATAGQFAFASADALPPYARHFLAKIGALTAARGVPVAMIDVTGYDAADHAVVEQSAYWPDVLGPGTEIVGLPGKRLYAGLTGDDIKLLYYDHEHLNVSGSEHFTLTVAPALLEIHARRVHAH